MSLADELLSNSRMSLESYSQRSSQTASLSISSFDTSEGRCYSFDFGDIAVREGQVVKFKNLAKNYSEDDNLSKTLTLSN